MSSRPINSSVVPEKRISPFSRNTARWASFSAVFTDCSTRMIAVPCAWMAGMIRSSCSTTAGASPRESSSIINSLGRAKNAWASESICCSPPERSPAWVSHRRSSTGKWASASAVAFLMWSGSERYIQLARRMFSATVSVGKMLRSPGTTARPRLAVVTGSAPLMSRPSKMIAPPWAIVSPAMARSKRRLARPVGAEQGHDLAVSDLEIDTEEHLRLVVAHLQVTHDEDLRIPLESALADLGLGTRREVETLDVLADVLARRGQEERADQVHRDEEEDAGAHSEAVADGADDRQDRKAHQQPERPGGEAQGAHAGRYGERNDGEDARREDGPDEGVEELAGDGEPDRR